MVAVLLGPAPLAPFGGVVQERGAIPIREALQDADGNRIPDRIGQSVEVVGVVTSDPFIIRVAGAALANFQDRTGGVHLFARDSELLVGSVVRGDSLRVRGVVGQLQGAEELRITSVERIGKGTIPAPLDVLAAELHGERFSGRLVRVAGELSVSEDGAGWLTGELRDRSGQVAIQIPDRLLSDPEFVRRLKRGGEVEIVGIASQRDLEPPFDAGYVVVPRDRADWSFAPVPPYREIGIFAGFLLLFAVALYLFMRRRIVERRAREMERLMAALRRSEEEFRLIAENVREVFWIFNPDFTETIYVSPAHQEIFGRPAESLYEDPRSFLELVHPEDREVLFAAMEDATDGDLDRVEYRIVRSDGSVRWVRSRGFAVYDERGEIYRIVGTTEDITERKEAARALRESEARLRTTFQGSGVGLAVTDLRTGKLEVNLALARMLGYPREELQEIGLMEVTHPDDRAATRQALDDLRDGWSPHVLMEKRYIRKDSRVVWAHSTVSRVRNDAGEAIYRIGVIEDVTERKQAEEALRESEARFRALIENISEAITILEADGTVRYVSPAFERITGYAADERVGRSAFERIHPEDVEIARREWQKLLGMPGGSVSIESRLRHRDGEWRRLELVGKNLLDDPVIRGIVVTYRDLTEHRTLEDRLRQAQKMEAVGRLAGGIAHDFNNVLTTIRGHAAFLLEGLHVSEPLREGAEEIARASERAASLTRQLLLFSRQQLVKPRALDLNATVTEMQNMLRRLIGEDIRLRTVLAEDLGAVEADPGHIQQVIMNLVVNARDAMPEGGRIHVETWEVEIAEAVQGLHDRIEPGRYVLLTVQDTGGGMDERTLARIFEPFYTTKEHGRGTGLGLSTVYGIVKQSGGHIEVESEIGQGTTFRVWLPRAEADGPAVAGPEAVGPEAVGPEAGDRGRAGAEGGSETVLVVEDEAPVRALIRKVLARWGYHILEAESGEEAVRVADSYDGPIHLVLTDVVMPGIGGRELADRLHVSSPGSAVLYMSGYTQDEVVRRGVREAGVDFLEKPFSPADLARAVRAVLDRSRPARAL